MKFIKRVILKVLFGNKLFRKGVKFGKGSYIREHATIRGGKFIKLGKHTRILAYSRLMCFQKISGEVLHPEICIGDNVIIGRNASINCCNRIEIGDNCMIAGYCFLHDSNHGMDPSLPERYEAQPMVRKTIKLGKNVWLGEKVMVLPGIEIGDNCIIGAGSVVTKSIENNCMAVGNPARVIKKFNFETREWEKI